jgi:hypothetical protein
VSRREPYARLEAVLRAFDPVVLEEHGFALGGATRIALAHGEVRVSHDLDFLGSDPAGFAALRARVKQHGPRALARAGAALDVPREPTIDQYGIRFPVRLGEGVLKVELVREARVVLEPPVREAFCDLPLLSIEDCVVEKLLANSDRGADPTQFHRDVIDLAILRDAHGPISEHAWRRAVAAYGELVRADLRDSLARILGDETRRLRDFEALRVDDPERVLRGLDLLATELGLPR